MNREERPMKPSAPFAVVVDDDPSQLRVLSRLLQEAGITPRLFTSAEAALADMTACTGAVNDNPGALPALVVTQFCLPGIDGRRFRRLLRSPEYAPFNHVPLLMVSAGFPGEESHRTAADFGTEVVLSAPLDGRCFVQQVQAILRGERMRIPTRVLIVQESGALAGPFRKAFEDHGYRADSAFTAREAAEVFSRTAYDAVVLDDHLPDGTGDALLDAFRAQRPECVCLRMTSNPGPESALDWMKRGAAAYVRKPCTPEYVLELCDEVRREHALLRAEEQLKAQTRKLRENEEILNATQRLTRVGGWQWDAVAQTMSWTEEVYRIHGFDRSDFPAGSQEHISRSLACYAPEDQPRVIEAFRRCMEQGEPYDLELPFTTADGRRLWIRTTAEPVTVDGRIAKVVGNLMDITDRKQEAEIQRSMAEMLNTAPNSITVHDADGRFLYANRKTLELHGYDESEFLGLNLQALDVPDSKALMAERMRLIVEKGEASFEVGHYRKDGTILPLEVFVKQVQWQGAPAFLSIATDITDRKRAQTALRKSESKMTSVFRAAPIGIGIVSDRVFLEVNDRFCRITGYSRNELIGKNARLIYPSDEEYAFVGGEKYRQLRERGTGTVETRFRRKDGRIVDILMSSTLIDSADPSAGVTFTVLDITDRKRAEAALRESEYRFRSYVENAGEIVYAMNPEGIFTYVSPNWIDFMGEPAEAAVGRSFEPYVHPEDVPVCRDFLNSVLSSGKRQINAEYRVRRKDGEWRWHVSTGSPLRDGLGKVISYIGIARDVTDHKQTEEFLRESEEKFRLTFDSSPDAVNINRLEDGLYVDINAGFTQLTGFTREDVIGRTSLEIDIWHDPADRKKLVQTLKEKGVCRNLEAVFRKKDGSLATGLMSAAVITIKGASHIISITRDMTERTQAQEEREKLEAQLSQAQKLESIGRLAGGVAHDFNNMLGAILGHTELAMEQLEPEHPVFTDLREIRKAAERSADLTRQLLAFARKQTIRPKILDMNETIEGMLRMLRRLIGEDIDLEWKSRHALWPVKVDPAQVDQILANLCVNARDAIAGVGKVTIETENIVFHETLCTGHAGCIPGEYVMLAVSDSGCGMDMETRGKLFEPFFTTKEIGKGTGLGLATVYGIVKQNNGFIDVYSEPGLGTTFKIYFPRHAAHAVRAPQEGSKEPAIGGRETILLVEDEAAILNMTAAMLERLGYTVLAASTPGKALDLAKAQRGEIHVLMSDVIMPEMNGRELAENLASLHPNIKRLFMSGYPADVIAHHGVLDKGIHFIQKPFSMEDMARRVRKALSESG